MVLFRKDIEHSQNLLNRKGQSIRNLRVDNVVIRCRGLTDFLEDTGQKAGGKNIADQLGIFRIHLKEN